MKYCCTEVERNGTCYHEFQKGKFQGVFWKKDSLLLYDDTLRDLHLYELFREVVPSYNDHGDTEITKRQWDEIYFKALEIGGEIKEAIYEINTWAENNFEINSVFTILGI